MSFNIPQEVDEALMSKMTSEEEEAVQAELEQLQKEALVRPAFLRFASLSIIRSALLFFSR